MKVSKTTQHNLIMEEFESRLLLSGDGLDVFIGLEDDSGPAQEQAVLLLEQSFASPTPVQLQSNATLERSAQVSTETWYLNGIGDGSDIPVATLERSAPTGALVNFDPPPDPLDPRPRDSSQELGLLLSQSSLGMAESDPAKYQLWLTDAGGKTLSGDASITLWSAVEDFKPHKKGSVSVYLVDSDASGADITAIASDTILRKDWDESQTSGWVGDNFALGPVNYDFADGRYLGIKIVVNAEANTDMHFAYSSTAFPSKLEIVPSIGNQSPTAEDDSGSSFTVNSNQTLITGNVLGNDSDADGDSLSITAVDTSATLGEVVNRGDGTFSYDPMGMFDTLSPGASATDSFSYTIGDGKGGNATATVTITLVGSNRLPVANNDAGTGFGTSEDTRFITSDVLTNDTPGDGETTITDYDLVSTRGGTVHYQGNGRFEYTPAANIHGEDSFSYQISDDNGDSSTAVVSIDVVPVNDSPTATADSYTVGAGQTLAANNASMGLLANDTDEDGDALEINTIPIQTPTHGSLILNADGTFIYKPTDGFSGTDSFIYEVLDSEGGTARVSATITVTPTPDWGGLPDPGPGPDDNEDNNPQAPGDDPLAPPTTEADTDKPKANEHIGSSKNSTDRTRHAPYAGGSRPGPPEPAKAAETQQAAKVEIQLVSAPETILFNQLLAAQTTGPVTQDVVLGKLSMGTLDFGAEHHLGEEIAAMRQEMEDAYEESQALTILSTPLGAATAMGISAGYFGWLLRGGAMFASMLSLLPVWSSFDPLPIVVGNRRKKKKREEENAHYAEEKIFGIHTPTTQEKTAGPVDASDEK